MRHFIIYMLGLLMPLLSSAQNTSPHFQKYDIGNSGAKAYFPSKPEEAELSYSEDSSRVYTLGTVLNDYRFDVIYVELKSPVESNESIEPLLQSYMDYLKTSLDVTGSAGYGKGHTLDTHAAAKGMIDYWKDKEKNELSVAAWADRKYMAILLITGKEQYPNINVAQVFFKGIRFPGD